MNVRNIAFKHEHTTRLFSQSVFVDLNSTLITHTIIPIYQKNNRNVAV